MPLHHTAPEDFQPPRNRRPTTTVWTAVRRNRLARALAPWAVLVLLAYVVGTLVVGPMIVAAAGIRRPPIAPTPAAVEGREPHAKSSNRATSIDDAKTTYTARATQPDEPDVQIEQVSSSERHRRHRRHHRHAEDGYTSRRRSSRDSTDNSADRSADSSDESASDSADSSSDVSADTPAPARRRHRRHHRSSDDTGNSASAGDHGQSVDRSDSTPSRDSSGDSGADRGGKID